MTIKERIMAIFNKKPVAEAHPFVEFKPKEISLDDIEKELDIDDDIKEELKLWDSVDDSFTVELEKATAELEEATIDYETLFEETFPGKHAIWGGKETKAFIAYKGRIMGE